MSEWMPGASEWEVKSLPLDTPHLPMPPQKHTSTPFFSPLKWPTGKFSKAPPPPFLGSGDLGIVSFPPQTGTPPSFPGCWHWGCPGEGLARLLCKTVGGGHVGKQGGRKRDQEAETISQLLWVQEKKTGLVSKRKE